MSSEVETIRVPLDQLHPHPDNPRVGDVDAIAASLKAHGQYRALVVRRATMEVLAGNHTLQGLQRLGHDDALVHLVDVDADEARRILLADNRTSDLGAYDNERLRSLLGDLEPEGLQGTGYDRQAVDELDKLLQAGRDQQKDTEPEPPPKDPICRSGETWILGEHRLACGDSRDPDIIAKAMGTDRADMVWTDPPYGVDVAAAAEARHGVVYADMAGDQVDEHATLQLVRAVLANACQVTLEGGACYVCHADTLGLAFRQAYQDAGWTLPTPKPVEVIASHVRNSAPAGGVVLDPFGGSGSTLIACENLGASARLIEIDPAYADVIIDRYQRHSDQEAVRE